MSRSTFIAEKPATILCWAREVVRLDRLRYKNPTRAGSFDFVGQDIFTFNRISYTESLLQVTMTPAGCLDYEEEYTSVEMKIQ